MFTLHECDSNGDPLRELCQSEFIDIISQAAYGIVARRASINLYGDEPVYVILNDGAPYSYMRPVITTKREWHLVQKGES